MRRTTNRRRGERQTEDEEETKWRRWIEIAGDSTIQITSSYIHIYIYLYHHIYINTYVHHT